VPVEPLLAAAEIAGTARAEELSVAQFCALARALPGAQDLGTHW
jgi:16S rRNA A1518/A1519 N6-dimethyltransferase RsmA/KsgA/DIM1 with predicted DNA glycosylase/AP lyase activity